MVESTKPRQALSIEHMNTDSRIKDNLTEYYECPICTAIPDKSAMMECDCGQRACRECIIDYGVKHKIVGFGNDYGICLGGCQDKQPKIMKMPNRILMDLLETVMMFNCQDCKRYWSYAEFKSHRNLNLCIKDPKADNQIEKLAIRLPNKIDGPKKIEETKSDMSQNKVQVKAQPISRSFFVLV